MNYLVTENELLSVGDNITNPEHLINFGIYLEKINVFRNRCGIPMVPSSFYRSEERQIRIYQDKAKNKEKPFEDGIFDIKKVPMGSKHMQALACDFAGKNLQKLKDWVLQNQEWCKSESFYFEHFDYTPTWIHIQIIPPTSGNLFFIP